MIHKFGIPSTDLNRADRFWVEDTIDATTEDVINVLAAHDTASGSAVAITDGADDVPVKDLTITISDANGVDECTVTKCGKNLSDLSASTLSQNQNCTITYTDTGVTVNATGTYARVAYAIPVKAGETYTIGFAGKSTGDYNQIRITSSLWNYEYGLLVPSSTSASYTATFTATTDIVYVIFYVTSSATSGTMTITDFQLELGTTATDFEAYTTPTTYTIDLGTTVTAGTLDVTTGKLTVTAPTAGTYSLDPVEVTTLKGNNTIWADCGSVSTDYVADTTLYIAKLTGSADSDMVAGANIASGDYFMVGNTLYLATAAISAGASIVPGTNCTATNLAEALNAIN